MSLAKSDEQSASNEFVSALVERVCSPNRREEMQLLQRHLRLRFYDHYFRLVYGSQPLDDFAVNEWMYLSRSLNFCSNAHQLQIDFGNRLSINEKNSFPWEAMLSKNLMLSQFNTHYQFNNRQHERAELPSSMTTIQQQSIGWNNEYSELDDKDQWIKRDKPRPTALKRKLEKTQSTEHRNVLLEQPNGYHRLINRKTAKSQEKDRSQATIAPSRIYKTKQRQIDKEIEADRRTTKMMAKKQQTSNVDKKKETTPVESDRSWALAKPTSQSSLDDIKPEMEMSFERNWSTWTLKKAEACNWDADFEDQPFAPQDKNIRHKFYKQSLIKQSADIERKRRSNLQNRPILAKIRQEQLMRIEARRPIRKPPMRLPIKKAVRKTKTVDNPKPVDVEDSQVVEEVENPIKMSPTENTKEVTPEDLAVESEVQKPEELSILEQIKRALHTVPEKIKEVLSFGNQKPKLERTKSTEIVEATTMKTPHSNCRSSSAKAHRMNPKCTNDQHLNALHQHNLDVDARLETVLNKPTKIHPTKSNSSSLLKLQGGVNSSNSKRRPISWRTETEIKHLKELRLKQTSDQRNGKTNLLPQVCTKQTYPRDGKRMSTLKLPDIKPESKFDPLNNPYRSAGRVHSPINEWPVSRSFNPEVGRCKIIDYIEQNWPYQKNLLSYIVEHRHALPYGEKMVRFKYQVRFQSERTKQNGFVYFNVDVSRFDWSHPIELSYRFQGQSAIHRAAFSPTSIPFRKRWIKSLEHGVLLENTTN